MPKRFTLSTKLCRKFGPRDPERARQKPRRKRRADDIPGDILDDNASTRPASSAERASGGLYREARRIPFSSNSAWNEVDREVVRPSIDDGPLN
jgi:hypothetical protein